MANNTETLDIIVIGLNEQENLTPCLCSAIEAAEGLNKSLQISSQLIYVDGNSTDDSLKVAQQFCSDILLAPSQFQTPANGRMAGLTVSSGSYVMFLDGDMEISKDWLTEGIRFLQQHHDTAAVTGYQQEIQQRGQKQIIIEDFRRIGNQVRSRKAYFGGACLFRRKALMEQGAYEPSLPNNEEIVLYCKLKSAGWSVYQIPTPMVIHWNTKLSSVKSILGHLVFGRRALTPGVVLRHAITKTSWWPQLLQYHIEIIVHLLFVFVVIALIIASAVLNQYRNLVYMTVLSLATIYLLMLTLSKRSFKRALIAVVMRTIYAANLALGLLLYYPKLPLGIQKSEEYKEMVTKANRHLQQS